jgi:hypothetical protein
MVGTVLLSVQVLAIQARMVLVLAAHHHLVVRDIQG